MNVLPKEGGHARRRWRLLLLAAGVGFVGRGGVTAGPTSVLLVLLALFVVVFLVTLAVSVVRGAPVNVPAPESLNLRPMYSDSPQVQNEAVYGSP